MPVCDHSALCATLAKSNAKFDKAADLAWTAVQESISNVNGLRGLMYKYGCPDRGAAKHRWTHGSKNGSWSIDWKGSVAPNIAKGAVPFPAWAGVKCVKGE
eukprot:NODE_1880_length_479_cov_131.262791_g1802_i0.p1 GENE.NODE_1880_length_479_cov_131.262791_g1802_i0~~NODE_1880_length_479_cov_131.262791_g1802_i0.p1  ORF type:complete len:101 (+),score=15.72 NODE_1880_length_479_cov_131.262791_g1802_i0:88-390(+)